MDRFDPFVKYADVYGDIINWEKDPMNKPQNQNKYFFSDGKTYYEQICKMLRLMSVFKEAFNQIYSNEDEISEAWENFVNNLSASVVEGSEPDVTLTWTDDSVNFEFTMVPGVPGEQGVGITSISFNSDYTMTITLSDGNTYTSMSLKGETGPQGPQGETGSGLQILDVYATLADLQSAHPTGQPGDAYQVGSAGNYTLYIWSSSQSAWVPAGSLGTVSPSLSNPLMDGTASAGSQNLYSRGDHVHPTDTSRASKEELDELIRTSQVLIDQNFTYRESPAIQNGIAKIERIKGNTVIKDDALISFNGTGIKTTGKNLLDFTIFKNNLNISTDTYLPVEYNYRIATETPIDVSLFNSLVISFSSDVSNTSFIYSTFKKDGTKLTRVVGQPTNTVIDVSNADLLYLCLYAGSPVKTDDIQYIQVENGSSVTDYEPYKESSLSLPVSQYFPTGMKSAGTVYDELTPAKAIIRIGSRAYQSGDESDTSVITDGVTTYYPLTTPTETDIDIDLYFISYEDGTEQLLPVNGPVPATSPILADMTYLSIDDAMEYILDKLANVPENTQQILDSLEDDVADLQTDVGALQPAVSALQTSVGNINTNIGQLSSTVAGHTSSISDIQSDITDLNTGLNDLEDTVTDHTSRIGTLETGLSSTNVNVQNLSTSVSGLDSTVTAQGETVTALDSIIQDISNNPVVASLGSHELGFVAAYVSATLPANTGTKVSIPKPTIFPNNYTPLFIVGMSTGSYNVSICEIPYSFGNRDSVNCRVWNHGSEQTTQITVYILCMRQRQSQ